MKNGIDAGGRSSSFHFGSGGGLFGDFAFMPCAKSTLRTNGLPSKFPPLGEAQTLGSSFTHSPSSFAHIPTKRVVVAGVLEVHGLS